MLKTVEKSWNEFWAYYFRVVHRHRYEGIFKWDEQLIKFIEETCNLSPPARILDLGCGGGDQARVFAAKGYQVLGIDVAPSLVEFAKNQFGKAGLEGEFVVGDMREIEYCSEFDLCTILSGTFGFFSDDENQELLDSLCRALVPGGKVFIMFIGPWYRSDRLKSWTETEDGWDLYESWYEAETGTYRARSVLIRRDGSVIVPKPEPDYNADERIRCYTIPEMRSMLSLAGLKYLASYNSKELSSPSKSQKDTWRRNIVVAEKPEE